MNKHFLVGCAVGDSLGVPWEMKDPDDPALKKWKGDYVKCERQTAIGQWSDDTQLSVALTSSMLGRKEFFPEKAAESYLNMYQGGVSAELIAGSAGKGGIRGIGGATRKALQKLEKGSPWWRAGTPEAEGNGTAMRASPLGVRYRKNYLALREAAFLDAQITHRSVHAQEASYAVALMTALLANGKDPMEAFDLIEGAFKSSFTLKGITELKKGMIYDQGQKIRIKGQISIGVDGHATMTTLRSLYVFVTSDSYEDAVLTAIRAGGDTDTTAAIVGSWAGIYYGLPPEEYLQHVEELNLLKANEEILWTLGEEEGS